MDNRQQQSKKGRKEINVVTAGAPSVSWMVESTSDHDLQKGSPREYLHPHTHGCTRGHYKKGQSTVLSKMKWKKNGLRKLCIKKQNTVIVDNETVCKPQLLVSRRRYKVYVWNIWLHHWKYLVVHGLINKVMKIIYLGEDAETVAAGDKSTTRQQPAKLAYPVGWGGGRTKQKMGPTFPPPSHSSHYYIILYLFSPIFPKKT